MTELLSHLGPSALWIPGFVLLVGLNLLVSVAGHPSKQFRWVIACALASIPLTFPSAANNFPAAYGILSTVLTTLVIVSAARLADLDRYLRSGTTTWQLTYLWMSIPMIRSFPATEREMSNNRKAAPRRILRGFAKRLCWEPVGFVCQMIPGETLPWPVRSAAVMLYFVLNMTAVADIVGGLCLLGGLGIDESFDAPLRSVSPREFWSRRWNKFINRFALKHVGLPLSRRLGPGKIILSVFAASGLFHEYFAWGVGGSGAHAGSMMMFFLVQGGAVWLGSRVSFSLPRLPSIILTYLWMILTAPLFFRAVEPAILAFGYPANWLP